MIINAFLPCKKKSSRVKNKNKRKFANIDFGLVKIKLKQLLRAKLINKIYLSTNDQQIINFAKNLRSKKIIIHKRVDKLLSQDGTITQKLITHAMEIIPDGHILWTHVTSPFVGPKIYDQAIKKYQNVLKKEYDSLMTVTKVKGFIWDDTKPINYNYKKTKWPRTQDIKPLNKINSAIFLNSRDNYFKFKNRLGNKPFMFELIKYYGLDIDDAEDFYLAEFLFKNKKIYK
jgi:CMP-N-acetylneuraminic acid synthetase